MCPRSGFGYWGTSACTLVPVFGAGNIGVYPRSGFWYRKTSAKTTLLETTLLRTPDSLNFSGVSGVGVLGGLHFHKCTCFARPPVCIPPRAPSGKPPLCGFLFRATEPQNPNRSKIGIQTSRENEGKVGLKCRILSSFGPALFHPRFPLDGLEPFFFDEL